MSINPDSFRILLFLQYCGDLNGDEVKFIANSHVDKWYFLSVYPSDLQDFLQQYGFAGSLDNNIDFGDLFIYNYHGVTLKSLDTILSPLKTYGLIKILDQGRKTIITVTKAGLDYISENATQIKMIQNYIEILITIKKYMLLIPIKKVVDFTNTIIGKYDENGDFQHRLKQPYRRDKNTSKSSKD